MSDAQATGLIPVGPDGESRSVGRSYSGTPSEGDRGSTSDGTGESSQRARAYDRTRPPERFIPPFCPNAKCKHHWYDGDGGRWYIHWGFTYSELWGRSQRYRCRGCNTVFCEQTFSVEYMVKRHISLTMVTHLLSEGMSVRAMARTFFVTTETIANRVDRLMRQALAMQADRNRRLQHEENLAIDGFRTFCVSQFFPCDITITAGSQSEYLYDFDYALLRRSGRMTESQRALRAKLDPCVPVNPYATRESFFRLLDPICFYTPIPRTAARTVWTDEHSEYAQAWKTHPHAQHLTTRGWLEHRTVSSLLPRTVFNPLFPVNYADREIRKDRADHRRETVCFARNVCSMLARLAVYFAHHNLLKPKRIVGSATPSPAKAVCQAHGVAAGLDPRDIHDALIEFATRRRFLTRQNLPRFYEQLWKREIPTPLRSGPEHVPAFALD